MIIVLNGADFSQNNIGKITIERDLSPETVALLAKYSKPLTKTQQLAVEDLLTALKTAGIYQKMTALYLPVIAANINEAFYEVISGQTVMPSVTDGYEVTQIGIKLKSEATNDTAPPILAANGLNVPKAGDCHFATVLTEELVGGYIIGSGEGKSVTWWLGANNNSALIGSHSSGVKATADANAYRAKGLKVGSNFGNSETSLSLNFSGTPKISQGMSGAGINPDLFLGGLTLGYGVTESIGSRSSHGLLSLGTHLTDEEMSVYSIICEDFLGVIL